MYLPGHFEETGAEALHGVIAAFPLGALVRLGPDGLDADHLPFELDAESFVRGVVARLTRTHEGRSGAERPWQMSDSPSSFIDDMLTRIVGIEIAITRMVGKWKLGQNREARDRLGAAAALRERGEETTAVAMFAAGAGLADAPAGQVEAPPTLAGTPAGLPSPSR